MIHLFAVCLSHQRDGGRLVVGAFTVYPIMGTVPPKGQLAINVECLADAVGLLEEVSADFIIKSLKYKIVLN